MTLDEGICLLKEDIHELKESKKVLANYWKQAKKYKFICLKNKKSEMLEF